MALGLSFHFYRPKRSIHRGICGNISDGVLTANFASDLLTNGHDFIQLPWEKRLATTFLRELFQRTRILVPILVVEDSDRVDYRVHMSRSCSDSRARVFAGVVASIADDDKNLLVPAAILQMRESRRNRVVQSGFAARNTAGKGSLQLSDVVGEGDVGRQAKGNVLVEVHDKDFILGVTRSREGLSTGNHLVTLCAHAAAVVNDQAYRHRNVFMCEILDFLKDSAFVYPKIIRGQPEDEITTVVCYSDVQNDLFGDDFDCIIVSAIV